jgi:hypothetical protein
VSGISGVIDDHDPAFLLASKVTIPEQVVYRSFPTETVVLNLTTGRYHGLNMTAGRMLEELERAATVRDAAATLAASYDQPASLVERDLCDLCALLLERGLIVTDGGGAGA